MKCGLCDRGIVPQFYGAIERLDLLHYQPHLRMFLDDKHPPNAILLEYIPNMEMIYPYNYTKKRGEALIRGIQEIHRALVLHCDAKPRNMMIIRDDPERVVWLDFDRAQTYHADSFTERQRGFIKDEELMVSQLANSLVSDQLLGIAT
jgi:serine/threonine protein kinase